MELYRITKKEHAKSGMELNGIGGLYSGGRWHSEGQLISYCASSRALAMLERLVHDSTDILSDDLVVLIIYIPDNIAMTSYVEGQLPDGWDSVPEGYESVSVGDDWLANGETCCMKVPSALCQDEYNIIINPTHADINQIKVIDNKAFYYEKRLGSLLK
jgi:RES domain-containing protein